MCNGELCSAVKWRELYFDIQYCVFFKVGENKCLVMSRDASKEEKFKITVPSITFTQISLIIISFWMHIMDCKPYICCMLQL
jgi:hypothetical protein